MPCGGRQIQARHQLTYPFPEPGPARHQRHLTASRAGLLAVEVFIRTNGDHLGRPGSAQALLLLVGVSSQFRLQADGEGLLAVEGGGDDAVQAGEFQEAVTGGTLEVSRPFIIE